MNETAISAEKPALTIGRRYPSAWIWAAWSCTGAADPVFLYGCCAPSRRALKCFSADSVEIPGAAGAAPTILTIGQAIIDAAAANVLLQEMATGDADLSSAIGQPAPKVIPKLLRQTLDDVLGHHGAVVDAYMTLPTIDPPNITPDVLKSILSTLKARLGLPFTAGYASHLGNFEFFHLADWLEQQKPFTIEAPNPQKPGPPEPIQALVVARSEAFANEAHMLHVECFSGRDTILDRIIILPEKEQRSPPIIAPSGIDSFAVRLFKSDGVTLLHKETTHFLHEVNSVISMLGRRITLDDKLTAQARGANQDLGEKAATVQAQSSSRSLIDMNGNDDRWRAHADRLQRFVAEHFSPQSADRWFARSVEAQVEVIEHINTLLHGGRIKAAILVDPFFGSGALLRLAMRLSSTDVELTIVTSLRDKVPDTGDSIPKGTQPQVLLEALLRQYHALINPKIKVMNLARPNGDQVFHDRYLLLYGHDGRAIIYMLSNSINKMAGNYPFCMTVLAEDIKREVQDYIEALSRGQDISSQTQPMVTFTWP